MGRKIQQRRGPEVNLPLLAEAEFALTTDTKKPFIGSDTGNIQLTKEVDRLSDKADNATITNNRRYLSKTLEKLLYGLTIKGVCYGDSLTWGSVSGVQSVNNYPVLLQAKLRLVYNYNNVTIVNAGVGGYQTDEGLANIQASVIAQVPDFAILMFGINDCRGISSVTIPLDDYKANYIAMIKSLRDNNIEVLILSSTPINDTNQGYNKKLFAYTKVAREIAEQYNCSFVDVHSEISQLFAKRMLSPFDVIDTTDNVHFQEGRYELIADIVMAQALKSSHSANVLQINDVQTIPVLYSPYVDTDCTGISTVTESFAKKSHYFKKDSSVGTYLRFKFYVNTPNINLVVVTSKNNYGGQFVVTDNSIAVKTVDCYSKEANTATVYEAEDIIIENLSLGMHSIEILTSGILTGQSDFPASVTIFLSEFKFVKNNINNNVNNSDYVFRQGSVAFGTLENFNKIADGMVRYKSASGDTGGAILFSKKTLELKTGKTLVLEIEGKFVDKSGITWFGNHVQGSVISNGGYTILLETAAQKLRGFGLGNSLSGGITAIGTDGAVAINFTNTHKIRIEHTSAGVITVFLDGTQIITGTNTVHKTGSCGLYNYASSVVGVTEVTRFEYCHI